MNSHSNFYNKNKIDKIKELSYKNKIEIIKLELKYDAKDFFDFPLNKLIINIFLFLCFVNEDKW